MDEAARFPRRARLLKPAEFKAVFGRGVRIHERGLTAVGAANTLAHARLGLAISKKALPLSVDRNRLKRQIREIFRLKHRSLPAVDLVVLAKPGIAQLTAAQRRQSLERLWTRIAALSVPASSAAPSSSSAATRS
ncbi:ribonuclease P protein component [Solimonas marina]|uniref:Ribonuclease P protein component n=1 Tax=Solimonas marina TaxID=2714601 RepID=A0A969W734_9GAMM|nr:ribonuclease P protein component [Solimonas marina]NKF21148.1 ribonuclease P protein component [Solimonas marina]